MELLNKEPKTKYVSRILMSCSLLKSAMVHFLSVHACVYFAHLFMLCAVFKWMVNPFVLYDKSRGVGLIKNYHYIYRLTLPHHMQFATFFPSSLFCVFFVFVPFHGYVLQRTIRMGKSVFNFLTQMTVGTENPSSTHAHIEMCLILNMCVLA